MEAESFGPYLLDRLLGRGGMGEVWRARDTRKQDRAVALKRLPRESFGDASHRSRFHVEARLAAQLNDPHVIPIHDYGDIDGWLYIDMRLVEGVDLDGLLRRHGPLDPARAIEIVDQVAGALDDAHRVGLIHRDVKPSNVLVTTARERDFAYLIDFGIACAIDGTSLTETGTTIGSPAYLAPERFAAEEVDHRVDVYSLACVLYECLTGRPPFGGDRHQLMHAHLYQAPPSVSAVRPDAPASLDDVIARGMAKDPRHRHPTAGALAADARAAVASADRAAGDAPVVDRAPSDVAKPEASGSAPRPSIRRIGGNVAGAVLLAGLLVVGGALLPMIEVGMQQLGPQPLAGLYVAPGGVAVLLSLVGGAFGGGGHERLSRILSRTAMALFAVVLAELLAGAVAGLVYAHGSPGQWTVLHVAGFDLDLAGVLDRIGWHGLAGLARGFTGLHLVSNPVVAMVIGGIAAVPVLVIAGIAALRDLASD